MLRQMKNSGIVQGLFSHHKLKEVSYNKNGVTHQAIAGEIFVKTMATIGGNSFETVVPVKVFINQKTKKGDTNQNYTALKTLFDEGKTIADVGEANAANIKLSAVNFKMNDYYNNKKKIEVSAPLLTANFIEIMSKAKPMSFLNIEMYITNMDRMTDDSGLNRFFLSGVNVGYGNVAIPFTVFVDNEDYVKAIERSYEVGDVIDMATQLDYSSKETVTITEAEIGDPVETVSYQYTRDFVLVKVFSKDLDNEDPTQAEIDQIQNERELSVAKKMADDKARGAQAAAPASTGNGFL